MCYTITNYHTICGCFGKPTISGEPCIRALTSAGSSRGCWDTTDLGVVTVASLCPRCAKGAVLSPRLLGDNDNNPISRVSSHTSVSSSGSSVPGMEMLEGIRRARSNMSLSSMASDRSNAPTSNVDEGQGLGVGDLERMAFCLTGTAPAPATAIPTPTPTTSKTSATSKKPWDPANLHWRTFGGSGASVKFKRSAP